MAKWNWTRVVMACGTVRHQLIGTPYFVDHAKVRAHFSAGQPVGLFGSGMHRSGCAAMLGCFDGVRKAKERAEDYATQDALRADAQEAMAV